MIQSTLAFGLPVGPELIVIVVVLVLLFGANKIPELARATGESIGEFRKGRRELDDELESVKDVESPATEPGKDADAGTNPTLEARE